MELSAKYNPAEVEDKWYAYWLEHKFFHSEPDSREPYTIVIPPPNVTGVLHMGHMLNNTIQDILVRRARMQGKNACWVPGTDHASIATEAKVVKKLAEQGVKKSDLSREEFLKHAWAWTEEHGGIILQQLRKLGASCDWDRTAFTMDEIRSGSVIKVFVDLYNKGLIYRGLRMVNWDPKAQTALSNEEVIFKDEKSKLYYLKYFVDEPNNSVDGQDDNALYLQPDSPFDPTVKHQILHRDSQGRRYAVVATTRPETIMGDTAMCINPKDPKNTWLKGKRVIVPLVNRSVPVIEDRYVDIEFGTGCLKVTPAHDANDYMLGKTHNLQTIDIFNPDATLSSEAGLYVGMDRMEVRKQIVKDLQQAGLLEKVEDYDNKVGYSERNSDTVVEPRLCKQWFLKMQHFADIALPPVMNDELKFYPSKYKTTYNNWLENIQDWCISRQLWWGHRIPAYFLPTQGDEEKFVVAENLSQALELAKAIPGYENISAQELRQDDDALDTWFSSWLWPLSLFNGILEPGNKEIEYYYPTNDLVTGPDIIFFWVSRMIMAGYEYNGNMPFKNVYFTGIVRDKLGRKMSKSLGNSPDPLELIAKYGADAVRMGMMLSAPAGNDILFDEALCEQGRNFNNKIWNAFRLVKGWKVDENAQTPESSQIAVRWFNSMLAKVSAQIGEMLSKYRLSDALMALYKLFWDDFCAWYLEVVKPAFGAGIDSFTYKSTVGFFDTLLKLLHPFMPFITEELWQNIEDRGEGATIMFAQIPEFEEVNQKLLDDFETATQVVMNVRNIRQTKGISPKDALNLSIKGEFSAMMLPIIVRMANLSKVESVDNMENRDSGASFLVGTTEMFIPLSGMINIEEEIAKAEAEIERYQKFLKGVEAKLSNEKFVNNAPEQVVKMELKKKSDATQKIENLQMSLQKLKSQQGNS